MIPDNHRSGTGMKNRLLAALLAPPAVCSLLAACSASTEVSLTGNTPAQYSHLYVTVTEVWFNTSATAGPDDSGWSKFPLSTPSTVDLVAQNGGNLASIASGLRIEAGTYSQIRLIPVDPSAPLAASAQNAGAKYNTEADYVDSSGTTQQVPLELLNPDKGIGIATSVKVPIGKVNSTTLAAGTGTTTGTAAIGTGTTTGSTTGTTTGTSGTSSTTQTPNEFTVAFNGVTDLVPFTFAPPTGTTPNNGIILSQHAAAYDLSTAGAISGQLTLTGITSVNGLPSIKVEAETLSADGSRHVVVATSTVQSNGSFMLYPLATTSSSTPLTYDVVIHGPDIATIIIKAVQVPRPSTSTTAATTSATTSTTPTGTATTPTTPTTPNVESNTATLPTITPVTIGTLTPRSATSYTANVSTSSASPLPGGAQIGFYQTINIHGEVPYLIESSPIDPFNQDLFNPQSLSGVPTGASNGTIDSGTWSTSGGAVSVVSAAPKEGRGQYVAAATAPFYTDGSFSANVAAPSSGTAPVSVAVPGITLASGTVPGALTATISQTTPGRYDQGELLVSHDGALVASTSLNSALSQGGSVAFNSLPAGTTTSLFYLSVRVWNSKDPSGTVQRQWYPNAIDMRSNLIGALDLTIN
jgi:hypothetical protein